MIVEWRAIVGRVSRIRFGVLRECWGSAAGVVSLTITRRQFITRRTPRAQDRDETGMIVEWRAIFGRVSRIRFGVLR